MVRLRKEASEHDLVRTFAFDSYELPIPTEFAYPHTSIDPEPGYDYMAYYSLSFWQQPVCAARTIRQYMTLKPLHELQACCDCRGT